MELGRYGTHGAAHYRPTCDEILIRQRARNGTRALYGVDGARVDETMGRQVACGRSPGIHLRTLSTIQWQKFTSGVNDRANHDANGSIIMINKDNTINITNDVMIRLKWIITCITL